MLVGLIILGQEYFDLFGYERDIDAIPVLIDIFASGGVVLF